MKRMHGLAVVLLLLTGCASAPVDMSPRIDYDHGTDFRLYKTYRWFDGPFLPGDPATRDEPQYRTVRDAINMVLRERGYDWQQFSPTDLVFHIHSGFDGMEKPESWITYNWYKPWWGGYGPMAEISRYDRGTLVLDVIDAKSTTLIWRGMLPSFYSPDGGIVDVGTLGPRIREVLKDYPAAIR